MWALKGKITTGDKLKRLIDKKVLDKAEPVAPRIVRKLRGCGGCKAAQRALNGGGLLEGESQQEVI